MKKQFKDPIAPTEKKNGKYPWTYNAPSHDGACSGNLPAGDYYGVGFRTPVGKERAAPYSSGPVPLESKCFNPNDLIKP